MKYSLAGVATDGWAVLAYTSSALKKEGLENLIDEMYEKAISSSYNNLVCVCMEYINKANTNSNDIIQYSIDVEKTDDKMQEKIKKALNDAGIPVIGITWKATWNSNDYYSGKPPVSSD